ncbi:hypothetical protein [Hymenobacter qilianensis]|uniref:hypothetical protein n=1 Tax=Hymenobacter qilianensis TaxID=1385715 RepID=UPI00166ABF37|nr:hypothetical protein [Hymenobacter qilianensis]
MESTLIFRGLDRKNATATQGGGGMHAVEVDPAAIGQAQARVQRGYGGVLQVRHAVRRARRRGRPGVGYCLWAERRVGQQKGSLQGEPDAGTQQCPGTL